MTYPKTYFEDEVRDGFFVPSIIKKSWASTKQVYDDLHRLCERSASHCAAAYGTLMGAIRHGGFIPWDDDVDIMMPREDFQKLSKMRDQKKFGRCRLVEYTGGKNKDIVRGFANYKESLKELGEHFGFPFGDMIDIFVYDYVPRDLEERKKYKATLDLILGMYNKVKSENPDVMKRELVKDAFAQAYLKRIEQELDVVFDDSLPVIYQLLGAIEGFCIRYGREECDEQAMVSDWHTRAFNQLFANWAFDEYIEMPFECGTIQVPIGYDYILRKIYGDYMQPRIVKSGHDYPYFGCLEKQLIEDYGEKLLRYDFDKKEVRENREKNQGKVPLKDNLLSLTDLLAEAHEFIFENYQSEELVSAVLDTLGQCQELAVGMGEQVESRAVQPERTVAILEKYCEAVYFIYQSVCEAVEKVGEIRSLDDCLFALRESIENDLQEKKEVVFLAYKAEYWKALHTYWEKMQAEEGTEVTVIALPYYYRKFSGEFEKEMEIETEGYPDEVTFTSYEEYNIEVHHPDIIVYQFPYDEYNYATSVHPFFYASNLRQYTEKMIFIPPFKTREVADDDERSKYTLKWLLCTPGVVYADEIIVQSEQMKQVYEDILSDFTKKDSDFKWSERIKAEGFPLNEWEERSRILLRSRETGRLYEKSGQAAEKQACDDVLEIPEEWINMMRREDGSFKKIILYYVSDSILYEHRAKAIEKIMQVLEVIRSHRKDIIFLWHMDFSAKKILQKKVPEVWKDFCSLRDSFVKEGLGIIDESGDCRLVVKLCDAYYGDAGTIMSECRIQGKPILWENPEIMMER